MNARTYERLSIFASESLNKFIYSFSKHLEKTSVKDVFDNVRALQVELNIRSYVEITEPLIELQLKIFEQLLIQTESSNVDAEIKLFLTEVLNEGIGLFKEAIYACNHSSANHILLEQISAQKDPYSIPPFSSSSGKTNLANIEHIPMATIVDFILDNPGSAAIFLKSQNDAEKKCRHFRKELCANNAELLNRLVTSGNDKILRAIKSSKILNSKSMPVDAKETMKKILQKQTSATKHQGVFDKKGYTSIGSQIEESKDERINAPKQ